MKCSNCIHASTSGFADKGHGLYCFHPQIAERSQVKPSQQIAVACEVAPCGKDYPRFQTKHDEVES